MPADTHTTHTSTVLHPLFPPWKKKKKNLITFLKVLSDSVFYLLEETNFAVGNDAHFWLKSERSGEALVELSLVLLAFLANAGVTVYGEKQEF